MTGDRKEESLDVEDLLANLAANAAEHQRVVAQRPDDAALSRSLIDLSAIIHKWVYLHREQACVAAGKAPTQTYAWIPTVGSPADADIETWEAPTRTFVKRHSPVATHWLETNPARNPTKRSLDHIARCFNTATDHLAAIGLLLGEDRGPMRSPITLSRSVLESSAIACFLTDTAVDARERLRRSLNVHFADLKETANEGAGDDTASGALGEIDELTTFATDLGFEVRLKKPSDWTPNVILGDGRNRADSARAMVDAVLPGGVGVTMWRSMSAVAHSNASQLYIPDEYTLRENVRPWQRTESIAWHVVPSLLVFRELCIRLENYLSWDFADWSDILERVILLWSIGAGMHDDDIRRRLLGH